MALGTRVGTVWTTRTIAIALTLSASVLAPESARADAFVDKASAAAAATPGTKPAQDILMPALAKLAPSPKSVGWAEGELLGLLLAVPGDKVWTELDPWASGETQQAALEALAQITTGKDRYILGFGYGADAVPTEWADAKLCVRLNKEGLLYSADYEYLNPLSELLALTLFESARAASGGDGDRALALCMQTIHLGRMLMERGSLHESEAGLVFMRLGLERLRDLMYQYESAFNPDKLREAASALTELRLREIPLPIVNKLAADQIIALTFKEKGSVDGALLAEVMSGAKTKDRPLTRLSEAAFWATRAGDQADWFDTTDKVKGVWADWEKRWKLPDLYDPIFDIPSDFRRMDAQKYLAVYFPLLGVEQLFDARKRLLTQVAGTVNAIGCVNFRIAQKTLPPLLASVEPKFVAKLQPDLFAIDKRQLQRTYLPFTFWVPIRDQKFDRREEPHPYKITVSIIPGGAAIADDMTDPGAQIIGLFELTMLGPKATTPPSGVVDAANMTVDANALREHLLSIAEEHKWTSQQLNALNAVLKLFGNSETTEENFDARYDKWFEVNGAELQSYVESLGIDVSEVTSTVKETVRTLLAMDSVKAGINNARDGSQLSSSDAKNMLKDYLNTVVQPAIVDKFLGLLKASRERTLARVEAAGGFGLPTTVFTAMVDDKQFLLYSVGENGIDDRARVVGPGGLDILMWPPILSLQRHAAQSAK